MGRHEIRLRRKNMTSRMIDRHKNYYEIMRRHQRKNQLNKLLRRIAYVIFLLGISLIIYFSIEKLSQAPRPQQETKPVEIGSTNNLLLDTPLNKKI